VLDLYHHTIALARGGLVPVRKTIVRRGKTIEVTYWVNPNHRKGGPGRAGGGEQAVGESAEDRASKLVTITRTVTTKSGKTYTTTVKIDPETHAARAARRAAWKAKKAAAQQGQPPPEPPAPAAKSHLVPVTRTVTTKSGKTYTTTVQVDPKTHAARAARRAAYNAKKAAQQGKSPPGKSPPGKSPPAKSSQPAKGKPAKSARPPGPPSPAARPGTARTEPSPHLSPQEPPSWVTETTANPDRFMRRNLEQLKSLSAGVQELTGVGLGAHDFQVTPSGAVYGSYNSFDRVIYLNKERTAALSQAVAEGKATTQLQMAAAKTTVHEMLHAASNPDYKYYPETGGKQLEEGTTELLAQHLLVPFVEGRLGLTVAEHLKQGPLVAANKKGEVEITRFTSYPEWVRDFARLVSYADDLDVDSLSPEQLSGHVAARALQVKKASDKTFEDSGRFASFVRPVLARHQIGENHPKFPQIRDDLHLLSREVMKGTGPKNRAAWDARVDRIIKGEDKGRKGGRTS
jgi:hypothetical protein